MPLAILRTREAPLAVAQRQEAAVVDAHLFVDARVELRALRMAQRS
jgi:hypothetical protein